MHYKETFGEYIRRIREGKGYPIRKVAAYLDLDPSTLSKIERGDRSANKEMVCKIAEFLGIGLNDLMVVFLSDKVMYELRDEECSNLVLQVAEKKLQYERQKRYKQGNLEI